MMRVQISFYATVTTLHYLDAEKGRAAYTKLSEALKEYRRFKNDTEETIEIECQTGNCTVKLERVDSILLEDGSDQERVVRANLETEKLTRSIREELGLPDSSAVSSHHHSKGE